MFSSAIVKLTSFCNLNCTYCYMFNLKDKTYLNMPKFMNIEDMFQILDKTYDYIQKKRIKSFSIILHGGEPFLWPLQNFERIFNYINLRNNSKYEIKFSIQ